MTSAAALPCVLGVEGTVISWKYRLESLLGEGGMGAVWRALNLQLEVPVAIKLLRADCQTPELAQRLRVEAQAVAHLVHPSIVRVFDAGESESGEPFIVMELLSGESLGTLLERGPLLPIRAVQLLLPIAEALSFAHSRGIVHRDLKPDNIFIAQEGSGLQPKLLDFGIAQVMSGVVPENGRSTLAGMLVGSPDYMCPEQVRGLADLDQRADVWGFCVVLYEAISGRAPFEGDTCEQVLRSVLVDEPPPLSLVAGVDRALAALVHAGLAKDREDRPASISELARHLAEWLLAQGAQNDVTGSSLETKWLGRPIAQPLAARLLADQPLHQARRWARSAWMASGALAACIAGLLAYEFQPGGTLTGVARLPTALPVAAALAAARHESAAATVPVTALSNEPDPAAAATRRTVELRIATPRVASVKAPATVAAGSTRTELMNPY
jgi:eukaryotic-like serine/threonine-protein kinase